MMRQYEGIQEMTERDFERQGQYRGGSTVITPTVGQRSAAIVAALPVMPSLVPSFLDQCGGGGNMWLQTCWLAVHNTNHVSNTEHNVPIYGCMTSTPMTCDFGWSLASCCRYRMYACSRSSNSLRKFFKSVQLLPTQLSIHLPSLSYSSGRHGELLETMVVVSHIILCLICTLFLLLVVAWQLEGVTWVRLGWEWCDCHCSRSKVSLTEKAKATVGEAGTGLHRLTIMVGHIQSYSPVQTAWRENNNATKHLSQEVIMATREAVVFFVCFFCKMICM